MLRVFTGNYLKHVSLSSIRSYCNENITTHQCTTYGDNLATKWLCKNCGRFILPSENDYFSVFGM